MNITKRIISTLLAVIMLLGACSALFTIQIFAAEETTTETEAPKTDIEDYVSKVYKNPQEKLATMEKMREDGNYQLWVDRSSGEVAWVETDASGKPTDADLLTTCTIGVSELCRAVVMALNAQN